MKNMKKMYTSGGLEKSGDGTFKQRKGTVLSG